MSSGPSYGDQDANQIHSPLAGVGLTLEQEDHVPGSHRRDRESTDSPPGSDSELDLCSGHDSPRPDHGALERLSTAQDVAPPDVQVQRTTTSASWAGPVHSVFTTNQKRFIVFMTAWAGFFSPVSANIYLPALNPLARDLNVSDTLINLTLTSYMIFQGLAPAFMGDFADAAGRRPAYAVCFTIYIAANIGLALQNSYGALFVLRCLQSTGSSATIAMCSAVVADIATAAERGKYMGFTFAGSLLGPAIGPVIGGLLADFLGWRAIFWFLVILASSFLLVFAVFFPETARAHVGNGSIPPKGFNMSLMNYLAIRKARKLGSEAQPCTNQLQSELPAKQKLRFPNPLRSVSLIFEKENAVLLFYNAFVFAAFYDVTAVMPSQLKKIFGFNELQIGLCYIPFGVGSMCAALTNGQLLDRNFARWCRKLGFKTKKGRNQDLRNFPIEKARLQVAIPAAYSAAVFACIFGWILHMNGPLAPLLVVLFFASLSMSITSNVTSTLMVDFYPSSPATASAANNVCRCCLGAGATAAVIPMVEAMGIGWTFTFMALFLVTTSPMLWLLYFRGMNWRIERYDKEDLAKKIKEEKLNSQNSGEIGIAPGEACNDKPPVEETVAEMGGVVEQEEENENEKVKEAEKVGLRQEQVIADEKTDPIYGHDHDHDHGHDHLAGSG